MRDIKYDFNDISLIPAEMVTEFTSRSEIEVDYLPLFIAPMDTVVDDSNYELFLNLGFGVCIPRKNPNEPSKSYPSSCFISYGLAEIEEIIGRRNELPSRVLIDVANAHSIRVYDAAKIIKENYECELMIGNIANPQTFKLYADIGVDYIRCGIGAGAACTTSANSSIHFPIASLVKECYDIKCDNSLSTKIVADGGFKNYDDIIKAIGLGANYVMLGSIINKSIESCGDNYIKKFNSDNEYIKINNDDAIEYFKAGLFDVYKIYRGMSTKEVQIKWGKTETRTAEGIVKYNKVEYSINSWVENFLDYLTTCMSYQGNNNLKKFIGKSKFIFITLNAYTRFNK